MNSFEKKTDEYLKQKECPNKKFVKEAGQHLVDIAKAKKSGDLKGILKHHEALDKTLHAYVGKEGLTKSEK